MEVLQGLWRGSLVENPLLRGVLENLTALQLAGFNPPRVFGCEIFYNWTIHNIGSLALGEL